MWETVTMIMDEKQFQTTCANADQFKIALQKHLALDIPDNIDPIMWQASIDSLRSILDDLEEEILDYVILCFLVMDTEDIG